MKVLSLCQDEVKAEELALALRMLWPDLAALNVSQGAMGLQVLGQEEPDLVMLCGDLSDVDLWSAIKRVRESSDIPVMVAVEGHGELDVVKALELGG